MCIHAVCVANAYGACHLRLTPEQIANLVGTVVVAEQRDVLE